LQPSTVDNQPISTACPTSRSLSPVKSSTPRRTRSARDGGVADEHVYVDDGISGAEFANRPGFLRLMNSLKPRPPFQVLVMSEEYHDRGRTVCQNKADVPMVDADDIVLEALLDDVIDPTMVSDAADEALNLLRRDRPSQHLDRIDDELATIEHERVRLANAIATGGELGGLLDALRTRDQRRDRLARRNGRCFSLRRRFRRPTRPVYDRS
jgi:hypothetical protein